MPTPFNSPNSCPLSYQSVTPSNTVPFGGFQYLYVSVAGNLEVQGIDDASSVTFAVTVGSLIPFGAGFIRTGTTATVIGIK